MAKFIIIEDDCGLAVAQMDEDQNAEEVAVQNKATLVDAGPYTSFDDAYDAMQLIPADEFERGKFLS